MVFTVVMLIAIAFRGCLRTKDRYPIFAPPRCLTICFITFFIWGIISCLWQSNIYANLAFFIVFSLNIYVCFYVAPNLIVPSLGENALLVYALPLIMTNVLNIVFPSSFMTHESDIGRLSGVLDNSTHVGAVAALTSIVALWMVINWPKRRILYLISWLVSITVLILSRTRSSIFGCFLGSIYLLIQWSKSKSKPHLAILIISIIFLSVSAGTIVMVRPELTFKLKDFFRINGNTETILESRMPLWRNGITNISQNLLFGKGPMEKFGGTEDPTVNSYDEKKICSNLFLFYAQTYGIVGAAMVALLLIVIMKSTLKISNDFKSLGFAVTLLIIGASLSQMLAVSFGSPGDRALWLILGTSLATCNYPNMASRNNFPLYSSVLENIFQTRLESDASVPSNFAKHKYY